MSDSRQNKILIIDFGSQYSQLIARRVREIGVYCELMPYTVSPEIIRHFSPKGVILSGGPESVTEAKTPRAPEVIFQLGIPVLGVCYGMQTMAAQLHGQVESSKQREFGYARVTKKNQSLLLDDIMDEVDDEGYGVLDVWMSHGDRVIQVPEGFNEIAHSNLSIIAAMGDDQRHFYGLQFHPEVTQTKHGDRILQRFLLDICHCEKTWTVNEIISESIQDVRDQVGEEKIILGLSGGVDSAVVAALLNKAIGKSLTCIFVDTGLLRLDEVSEVQTTFADYMGLQLIVVDAKEQFYHALKNIVDPEEKRKIIGKLFINIFEAEAKKIKAVSWLAQGTIYPDVIESAAIENSIAHNIKSHHNVGGLPKDLPFKLVEPLRRLFKDEVRKIGLELGLPSSVVYRHPFPGPGLAIRVLGEVKPEYVEILRQADAVFIDELRNFDYYRKVSQAFAVFIPVKTVGVMGDARKYEYVIGLRAVKTVDFMTADWAPLPYELLERVSSRIINEVSGISRVVYDISSKPPATIEWE